MYIHYTSTAMDLYEIFFVLYVVYISNSKCQLYNPTTPPLFPIKGYYPTMDTNHVSVIGLAQKTHVSHYRLADPCSTEAASL